MVWFINRYLKKTKSSPVNHLIILGSIFSLVLMFVGFGLSMANANNAGQINVYSLLMYLSSYAFVGFAVLSVYRCFKLPEKRWFRFYYVLTSISVIALSIYLWDIGFIGLRLWSY